MREGKKGEKYQCGVASPTHPNWDLAHNPGMCPDWKSNYNPLVCRPALNPLSHTNHRPITTLFLKKDFLNLFLEIGEGREKAKETSMCGCLLHTPYWGPNPGMCPDRERTSNPLVHKPALSPLSHTSQGPITILKNAFITCHVFTATLIRVQYNLIKLKTKKN